ncbi:MAG: hypothetical protein M1822_007513 [Bathelium mastoideum]|nr:MAG: hypothetical protein M1822_007513 [Bathelium mastoideum]
MYASILLAVVSATCVCAQGAGEGLPPPPPQTLSTTLSGVLPVIPTATPGPFAGVETEEGAIIDQGPANPSFEPVNGPATTQTNLPAATYQAVLPSTNFDNGTGSTVTGSITISSTAGGSGVNVIVNFAGFPNAAAYGPFLYHIHEFAVPTDGNCTATVGHLDPTDRGEYYPCNSANPASCQVGDLAGKYGKITQNPFIAHYSDAFLSTNPSSPSFFGDKSIVIHSSNTTRLTCANFQQISASNTTGSNATSPATPSQTVVPYNPGNAAGRLSGFGALGVFAAVFAVLL